MKKLLLSSIVLFIFSASILLFQISCKKEAKSQNLPATTTQQSKLVYLKDGKTEGNAAIYTANYDGSDEKQILIDLPVNLAISSLEALSPDRGTIFFTVYSPQSATPADLYSCNFDGSNIKKVVTDGWNVIAY